MISRGDLFLEDKREFRQRDIHIQEPDNFIQELPAKLEQFLNPSTTDSVATEIISFLPKHLDLITNDQYAQMLSFYADDENLEDRQKILSNISLLFYYILMEKGEKSNHFQEFIMENNIVDIIFPRLFPFFNTPLILARLLHKNVDVAVYLLQSNILNLILQNLNSFFLI